MESIAKKAVVIKLMRALAEAGSWCGETHVQKAVFMLQTVANVPTGYDYILYKHGPFSFGLRDELATMRAENLVELVIRNPDYGPAIAPTASSERLENAAKETLFRFQAEIAFVARAVGNKGVSELERIATALLIFRDNPTETNAHDPTRRLKEVKPHVSEADAVAAITEARRLMNCAPRAA